MSTIARVAVEQTAYHYDKLYDYALPPGLKGLQPGCRVMVGFGSGRRSRTGLVVELAEGPVEGLKPVLSAVDEQPALDAEGLMLLRWLKENTFCTWFDALSVLLPAGFGVRVQQLYSLAPNWQKLLEARPEDAEEQRICEFLRRRRTPVAAQALCEALGLAEGCPALAALAQGGVVVLSEEAKRRAGDERLTMVGLPEEGAAPTKKLTEKQQAVADLLAQVGQASLKEICYFTGVSRSVVDKTVEAGAARYFEVEVYRDPYKDSRPAPAQGEIELSPHQQQAFESLQAMLARPEAGTALLYGVTGSGKTQVFLKLIGEVLARGRTVIVLVPEIALTPQTIAQFQSRFGSRVAVLHSGLSMTQRLDEWKRARRGEARIVVGTRSAVFAPLPDLGLIVIDEEQEHTYHSERAPRFDARQVAQLRARYNKAGLVLCSATPSVESFDRAKKGDWLLVPLRQRYGTAKLPDVNIIDMKQDPGTGDGFSQTLLDELYQNLQAGEQSVLLLNRRGHSTQVKCMQCGAEARCPNCDVTMTYHTANGRLVCHYCGHSTPKPEACPTCGSAYMHYSGLGTQRAEQRLKEIFPTARILRMDTDTTMSRFAHEKLLGAFGAGEYDIMLGTQMVAKGLDFPKVTLVGVLSADQALFGDSFRSYEHAFSLITQVVGRCGRSDLPGRAFIQTWTPENPVIELAATQQYEAFYSDEIIQRKLHLYPPYCRVFLLGFSGESEAATARAALRFAKELARRGREDYPQLPLRLLGPSEAGISRVAGKYRWKLLLKCRNDAPTRQLLSGLLADFGRDKENKGVSMFIDPGYDSGF
ncbi:MAG: primosomal protein N' [Oscillospiraceae bacterium]|nr:primosomal protein N' [Oscillospiraceae bacterium]